MRDPMPTMLQLDHLYADLYTSSQIESEQTHQESGERALRLYAKLILRQHLTRPEYSALDYGSGSGALVALFRKSGIGAIGVERADAARAWCSRHRGFSLYASLDDVPNCSIDFVSMIEVIEHLPEPWAVLHELRQRLRPGGTIFITTPNLQCARARLEGGMWREAVKKFHVALYDEVSLSRLLGACGFTAIERLRYSPVQRRGALMLVSTRLQQAFGLGGDTVRHCSKSSSVREMGERR